MSQTHFKKLMNPNYLGSYAIDEGKTVTATIKSVAKEKVIGEGGATEDCIVCHFAEADVKPMILNATNCKKLAKLTGTPYIENWTGKKIVIGVEKIRAFGELVEALRIQKLADSKSASAPAKTESKGEEIICEDCKEPIVASFGLSAAEIAAKTKETYKKVLCPECAAKLKAKQNG